MNLKFRIGGLVSVAALALTGCAGGVGSAGGEAEEGEGVEYGASKEEYIEALADMEPVELTYQASASPSSPNSDREREFVERVEEWSDGKITMDMQFGQPIVGYGEIAARYLLWPKEGLVHPAELEPQLLQRSLPVVQPALELPRQAG